MEHSKVSVKYSEKKLCLRGSLLLVVIQFLWGVRGTGVGWGWALIRGGRLFE